MAKLDTFKRVKEVGIIPAIRTSNQDDAVKAAEAIKSGGIPVIEISLAPKNALDVLDAVAMSAQPVHAGGRRHGSGCGRSSTGGTGGCAIHCHARFQPGSSGKGKRVRHSYFRGRVDADGSTGRLG